MGNFDFVRATLPTVYQDCARAESYLTSDPRASCIYGRRAIEELLHYLYGVLALEEPYRSDLAARIDDPDFRLIAGDSIARKLTSIRKITNRAVHDSSTKPITPDIALAVLRELFHVTIWAAFNYSPEPSTVPTGSQFDPGIAAKAAPLTRADVAKLAEKFSAQDDAHAKALAERDALVADRDAQISELRDQIAQAQRAREAAGVADLHDYSTEADTRRVLIDETLQHAGWDASTARGSTAGVGIEVEVSGMPNATGAGFIDYVLWGADGLPLAVVEAKKTMVSPQVGEQQATLYADRLEAKYGRRPVIFLTNGIRHRLWDDAAGYPPRDVQGFYTRDELELLIARRRTRLPLEQIHVDEHIAGRAYQQRAIRAVDDVLSGKQRRALLVMATGSGKTRTVIALIDQLMRAGWVKRALFLADRTALVKQAANAFKTHLPKSSPVNLVTDRHADGRVYLSTYPTMMNLINEFSDGERRFGPGYFDLIVIDEAHRSVYAKYGAIFDWFDGMLIGLTATPKNEVDQNTYRLFQLEEGVPTDAYGLDDAIDDGYLVPPKGVALETKFLRDGIRYDDLTDEEKDEWDTLDWGDEETPVEIDSEALNRFLFNTDTVDKVIATLMTEGHKVAGGDRLGKTIIFAKNQRHAEFIRKRFDAQWPEHAGRFARVITHSVSYADTLIEDFGEPGKAPHIAISVDMLDTGIDVPDVVNLVFFKRVRSKTKFWQMIGRGTRLRPDLFGPGLDKQDFLVFDFCGNLEFFSQNLPTAEGSTQKSLTERLFEARMGLVTAIDRDPARAATSEDAELRASTARVLREFVEGMNTDNFLVRPHRQQVDTFSAPASWNALTPEAASEAVEHLAGLPSANTERDEDAKRFDLLVLRRQLAQLDGDAIAAERLRSTIQQIAEALLTKTAIPSVAEQAELIEQVSSDDWWVDVTLPMLELARLRLRALVRFIDKTRRSPVYTDFRDELGEATSVDLPGTTPGMDFERFRQKAAAYLREHESHIALQRLRRNRQLTGQDLTELEAMLIAAGGQSMHLARADAESNGLGLGGFVRSLVGLDREAAIEAFARFLDGSTYTVAQVRFVNLIVDELTANGVVEPRRLYESPYTDDAPTGPDYVFPEAEVEVLVETLHEVKRRATVAGHAS